MGLRPTVVLASVLTMLAGMGVTGTAGQHPETVAGIGREEALRLGERMYRDGLLSSGKPLRAFVQGDIPVDGTMFSCASCHLRSGVGSIEGTVITLPTNAGWLYQPLRGARMTPTARERLPQHLRRGEFRPAYTDRTLAKALRAGVDPGGRQLNLAMPRYLLADRDMELMIYYLKNLSATPSPGVTPDLLRLATVITDDVAPEEREAMLSALEAHVRVTNAQSRHQERRSRQGPFYKEEKFTAYRRLELSRWELTGPPETWRAQLETYQRAKPVFALVAGISGQDWRPIHEFCEQHRIPNLFPITDFPVVSDDDWYTLYFSKGWYQEGVTAARYLAGRDDLSQALPVLQVFRDDRVGGSVARGFRDTRATLGQSSPEDVMLESGRAVDRRFWTRLTDRHDRAIVLLWLSAEDLAEVGELAASPHRPTLAFVSTKLLGEAVASLPEGVRPFTYLTHPYTLPGEKPRAELAVRQWLKSRGLPLRNERIQSQMYFVGSMLAGALKHMRHDFYRDYLLDVMDMMRDQYYMIATYPRLSFGPGQRYASKGGYVVQLTAGPRPTLVDRSGWVVH